MRLSPSRLVVPGVGLLIVAALFYASQTTVRHHPDHVAAPHAHSSESPALESVSSAPNLRHAASGAAAAPSPDAEAGASRAPAQSSSMEIEEMRKEIAGLETSMLKQQIAMNSMLKNGLIKDPDPEKSDVLVSVPDAQGSVDESAALRAKDDANAYVQHKAIYLGQKALWKALHGRLRAAELARKK
jgi:hypothetical protein